MTTAVICAPAGAASPPLARDLGAAGVHVLGAVARNNLVQETVASGADVLVVHQAVPDAALFDALARLQAQAPRPVLMFTDSAAEADLGRALAAGVAAYVVAGYGPARLAPLLALAQQRFRHERELHARLADALGRFEERKQVDRAKGLLMRARGIDEEQAFAILRSQAMNGGLRIGDIARRVVESARIAADVNRSGALRMLSQRIVKLQALRCARVRGAEHDVLLAESVQRCDSIVQGLARDLPTATFGDGVGTLQQTWLALRQMLDAEPQRAALAALDERAEQMLMCSDRLTAALEGAASGGGMLRIVNACGRQRMLSQRTAKHRLLAALLPGDAARHHDASAAAQQDYERGVARLEALPLADRDIRAALAAAAAQWAALLDADAAKAAGRATLGAASEALLGLFDGLTGHYERSLQALVE